MASVLSFRHNHFVGSVRRIFLSLFCIVPAIGMFAAVQSTPSSATALPTIEIAAETPIKLTPADLGAHVADGGLVVDDELVSKAVARISSAFGSAAVPDTYELQDERVVLVRGRPGVEVDKLAAREMLVRALRGSRSNLRVPVKLIAPPAGPRNAIVISLEHFRLDFYDASKLATHFPVGVGALGFSTPPGVYHVKSKAKNPTWSNPGSSWARSMPRYIPPGPRNPLGTRAMRLDRGALVIHGTPQPWTIGRRSSHGCIRMRKADVEKLYEMVPEGTPVFIVP